MLLVNKDSLTLPDVFPMVFRLSWRFGGSVVQWFSSLWFTTPKGFSGGPWTHVLIQPSPEFPKITGVLGKCEFWLRVQSTTTEGSHPTRAQHLGLPLVLVVESCWLMWTSVGSAMTQLWTYGWINMSFVMLHERLWCLQQCRIYADITVVLLRLAESCFLMWYCPWPSAFHFVQRKTRKFVELPKSKWKGFLREAPP